MPGVSEVAAAMMRSVMSVRGVALPSEPPTTIKTRLGRWALAAELFTGQRSQMMHGVGQTRRSTATTLPRTVALSPKMGV